MVSRSRIWGARGRR